jgi:hydrogenase maturation protease
VTALVVGLGQVDRGDDAVGPAVARAVADRGLDGVVVMEHEDPTSLIDSWEGHDLVVVVDAVRAGSPGGTVHLLEAGAEAVALPVSSWATAGRDGTHAFGLGPVVELARALGRLPRRLVLVGVEAEQLDHGAALSPAVLSAVETAADHVATLIAVPERAGP